MVGRVTLRDGTTVESHVCYLAEKFLRSSFGTFWKDECGAWRWTVDRDVTMTLPERAADSNNAEKE